MAIIERRKTHTILERNFMDFGLFAASEHSSITGLSLEGTIKRSGTYRLFRLSTTLAPLEDGSTPPYPGPQSRSVHMALLSMMTDQPRPWPLVIPFKLDDLCDRLKRSRGGHTYEQLRASIVSTACLVIWSHEALYDHVAKRAHAHPGNRYQVYDSVCWQGEALPDGQIADRNYIRLSEWLYYSVATKGVITDFEFWLTLHKQNFVASRLWEYLHPCFFGGNKDYTIEYNRLIERIPLKKQPSASLAKRQLSKPLKALIEFGVIDKVEWDHPKMVFWRGQTMPTRDNLAPKGVTPPRTGQSLITAALSPAQPEVIVPLPAQAAPSTSMTVIPHAEMIVVPEAQAAHGSIIDALVSGIGKFVDDEHELVDMFFKRHYRGDPFVVWRADYPKAKEIIEFYGMEKAKAMLPEAIRLMEATLANNKRASSFGLAVKFILQVAMQWEKDRRNREERQRQMQEARTQAKKYAEENAEEQRLLGLWNEMDEAVRLSYLPGKAMWHEKIRALKELNMVFVLYGEYTRPEPHEVLRWDCNITIERPGASPL